MGRFLIPDWSAKVEPVPYSKLDNPQTLSLYSYILNNPLSNVDADGHARSGILGNTGSDFCKRATEYGQIDDRRATCCSIASALLRGGRCCFTGPC